jgi:glycosyltransferase involved in cell wall biosynthesis
LEPRTDAEVESPPLVVFAGRHIPEKRVPVVPEAIALARRDVPDLRGLILGDGPERGRVLEAIAALGLADAVRAPGFVAAGEVADALARATCLVLPSVREGYGLVVIEAAAELIDDGENGVIADAPTAEALAAAIVRVLRSGGELRTSTRGWFGRRAASLALDESVDAVVRGYAGADA